MLEPLAASVISTVFSARPLAGNHTAAHSVFKNMARATGSVFPPNFFNPHPRSVKGKERAGSEVHCGVCTKDGVVGDCIGNLATTSSSAAKRSSSTRSCRPRIRRFSGSRPLSDASPRRISNLRNLTHEKVASQQRHASSIPARQGSRSYESSPQLSHVQQLTYVIKSNKQHNFHEAWQAYEFSRLQNQLPSLPVSDLLTFAEKLVGHAEVQGVSDVDHYRRQWGLKVQAVLQDMESRILQASPAHQVWQCLMTRALTLIGRLEEATESLHAVQRIPLEKKYEPHRIRMYQTFLLVYKGRGEGSAVKFLMDIWPLVQSYLPLDWSSGKRPSDADPLLKEFQSKVESAVLDIRHPDSFFADFGQDTTSEWKQMAGIFLIRVYCQLGFSLDALAIYRALQSHGIEPPAQESLSIVKSLTRSHYFEMATELYTSMEKELQSGPQQAPYCHTGLYLYSHQGVPEQARYWFDKLAAQRPVFPGDIALLTRAHAHRGDTVGAAAVFDEFFSGLTRFKPTIVHFTVMMLAHLRADDIDGMNTWLRQMDSAGIVPDAHVFSTLLQGFATRGDLDSINTVLNQMRQSGMVSAHSYTSVIALLARKKEALAAEQLFARAIKEGVVPDHRMVAAIMNAHVEAGNWQAAVTVFDHMRGVGREQGVSMSVGVYNILLKAYIMLGAPWSLMERAYNAMMQTQMRPDAHTYSLFIQSACDNENMTKATELYKEMQKKASAGQVQLRPNVFVLTILMAGWLKKADKEKAMAIYDLMLRQGIQPTAITFNHIVKAYSSQRSVQSIKAAQHFVEELMLRPGHRDWLSSDHNNKPNLELVYGPLITAYARKKDPKKVEELLKEVRQQGGQDTVGTLTALLHGYRCRTNATRAKHVWKKIYKLARMQSPVPAISEIVEPEKSRLYSDILCLPLSIYVDALSADGRHASVARVWQRVKADGFSFDSGNWNQLAVALVRAGQPMRAFDVLERVLLPLKDAPSSPSSEVVSPLSLDPDPPEGSINPTPSPDRARRSATLHRPVGWLLKAEKGLKETPSDFASYLRQMFFVPPTWSGWEPHPKLLELLYAARAHLARGGPVLMVPRGGGPLVKSTKFVIEDKGYSESGYAKAQLQYIDKCCPRAVRAVEEWSNRVRQHFDSLSPDSAGRTRYGHIERKASKYTAAASPKYWARRNSARLAQTATISNSESGSPGRRTQGFGLRRS